MSSAALVDQAQRHRIERDGLDETLFVEAGAGTGKTHELVERVVSLVIGGVPLATIAAITFTEAAAAELRDRIRERLERVVADPAAAGRPDLTPEQVQACDQAMADIDQAAIGTLHGFCLRILSEHPIDVDLPPRVEILDEVQSQLAFQQRWRDFVDGLYNNPATEALILRAWALKIEIHTTTRNKASFKDVAGTFDDSWDRLDAVAARPLEVLGPLDLSPLASALRDMRDIVPTCRQPDAGDLLYEAIHLIDASVTEVLDEPDPVRQLQLLCDRHDGWKCSNGRRPNWDDIDAAKDSVVAVRDAGAAVVAGAVDQVLRQLTSLLARFTLDAAKQRQAEGQLDFHDLLVLARRLLRTSPEARAALHDRYQRLLLDEFQDTDPIQIEVAVLIAAAVEGDAGGEADDRAWPDIATEDGRLFFVGDPKQSIYRFRRADIGLFLAARDRFAGADQVVLSQNFRTVEPILDWVNHAFAQLMPTEEPGRQPAYQPLHAHRAAPAGSNHRVSLLGGRREDIKAGPLRDAEADLVARTVASIGADPSSWPVFDERDPNNARWRDPRWSDVTILIPTRTSLRQLEDALDLHGVPYRVATGSLVYDTQEVLEVLDALRAVDDHGDELALVSALRSPLYACSDVDLFTFRKAGGRWNIWKPGDKVPTDHPVLAAMAHLRSLAELRWWDEPSALLERLLRERNAFALAFGSRRPREVWRRLRFIVDQARAFEEAGGGGLRGFLDWADLQRNEGTRVHEPLLAETDDDAVSILTIHGAKGLEFPITVLSGTTTQARNGRAGPRVIWNGDIPEVKLTKAATTQHFDRLADIEAEMDVHERKRLLYVACTRARDHLVLSGFHVAGKEAYGEWLTQVSADLGDDRVRRVETDADPVPAGEAADVVGAVPVTIGAKPGSGDAAAAVAERDAWLAAREALIGPQRSSRFVSATTIAGDAAAAAEVEDREAANEAGASADPAVAPRPHLPWRRGRAGTAIGRAVHATLQFVEDPDDDARLVELATQHAHVEAIPELVDTVVALARSALAAPAVQAARAAERSWRELYVAAPLGDRAVEGYIDLLYETPEGLVLVDYKTDAVKGPADVDAKVARYALQTAAYAVAIERSTGLPVVEARLVFCTTGEPIERAVPDLDAAKDQVLSLVGSR